MDRDQKTPAHPDHDNTAHAPLGREENSKLGRETPGKGLDTGVDTGVIQPGQSGDGGRPG